MRQISMQEVLVGGALRVYTGGRKRKEAEYTLGFWKTFPGKMTVNHANCHYLSKQATVTVFFIPHLFMMIMLS